MGSLPWPGSSLSIEGMLQKWTLIWACFESPEELWGSLAFPNLPDAQKKEA